MTDLHAAVDAYLTQRRSFGHKLQRAGGLLHQFIDHVQHHGGRVTTLAAPELATLPTTATAWWWRQRLSVVRGFARYLQATDPTVEVPPPGLIPARAPRATPHIYSDADIAALLAAATRLRSPLRQATYQTFIGLLAATGMRAGEAIALDDADVDLADRLIVVRHAKFDKTRLLVVHPTTASALDHYRHIRQQHQPQPSTSAFFVSTVGTRLFYPNVSSLFRRLTRVAGLTETGHKPRLHDFRHSWTVRWLVDWHRDGVEVGPRLPGLSTYLGHTKPAGSYWYLTATPELLALAAQRLEAASRRRGRRMTLLAPTLEAFFTQRLMTQLHASPHTIASYRDSWRLLLGYIHDQTGICPSALDIAELDALTIGAFRPAPTAPTRPGASRATTPPTPFSPSSKTSDYTDHRCRVFEHV